MKNQKLVALFLAVGMLFSLVACGGGSSSGSNGSAAGKDSVTIRVASRYGADVPDEDYYRQKVEEFNALDNGIIVEMDNIPTESEYLDKLRTSFASGDTPNVFIEYGGSRTLDYLEADALVNMEPYFEEDSAWKDTFYPAMFDELQYDGYDGTWGVPFKSYIVVLYYNTEIFEENNLTPPSSFDDLQEVCEQLLDLGIKPFQTGEKDVWRFGHFHNNLVIKSLGTEAVDNLANRSLSYDSAEMLETYALISDMVQKGYFGEDILNTDYNTEKATFASGGSAMRWDGSWYVSEIFGTETYDRTGIVAFPYVDEAYANMAQGGSSDMWFVSKLNKSEEEIAASVEFLKFITSQDYFAGNNEVAAVLYPADFEPTAATPANPLLDTIKEIASNATDMRTDIQNYDPESHMLDTVRNALQGLAMGNTPEECGAAIVNNIQTG